MENDIWIAGLARGHNSSVCLLKNGEIVLSIEEERLSRRKYDGGPFAAMVKILDYTDKLDYLVIAHTQSLEQTAGKIDFSADDVYTGLARKLGLIDRGYEGNRHPQVIDLSIMHHKLHAAAAFYRSPFDTAVAVIADGAGSVIPLGDPNNPNNALGFWEYETIINCSYPSNFSTKYKHLGCRDPITGAGNIKMPGDLFGEEGEYEAMISDRGGITKAYEAVTTYCGWAPIEAGKTMGLFPYGNSNSKR